MRRASRLVTWWKVKGGEECHVELVEVFQEVVLDQVSLECDLEVEMDPFVALKKVAVVL